MLLGAFRIALLLVFLPSALQTEAPLLGTFPGRGALMNNFFRFIRECRSGHSILVLTLSGIKKVKDLPFSSTSFKVSPSRVNL